MELSGCVHNCEMMHNCTNWCIVMKMNAWIYRCENGCIGVLMDEFVWKWIHEQSISKNTNQC